MAASASEPELITGAELARRAGVTGQSISFAIRGKLKAATVGRQILAAHPLVLSYVAKHAGRPKHVKGTTGRPRLKEGPPQPHNPLYQQTQPPVAVLPVPPTAMARDPLACACQMAHPEPRSG